MSNVKFKHLAHAEQRLASVKRYYPDSPEVKRFDFAVRDLYSKLTPEEHSEYEKLGTAVQDAEADEAEYKQMIKDMNENKDKPSI